MGNIGPIKRVIEVLPEEEPASLPELDPRSDPETQPAEPEREPVG